MFGILKKVVGKVLPTYGKPSPEGPCSRFGSVSRLPFAHRRPEIARELEWLQSVHADMTGQDRGASK